MRWCVSSSLCACFRRNILAFSFVAILIICLNQAIYYLNKSSGPSTCIQIISPFTSFEDANEVGETRKRTSASLLRLRWTEGRFDERKTFRIFEWVRTGSLWTQLTRHGDVCLATQASIERLDPIGEVCEKWLGPISLSVMVRNDGELGVLNQFISYMSRCNALFTQSVSMHLVIPVNSTINEDSFLRDNNEDGGERDDPVERDADYPCGRPKEFLDLTIKNYLPNGIDYSVLYNQNLQRNVARKTCLTDWVFMTDVDIIPAPNSSSRLQEFYRSRQSKCSKWMSSKLDEGTVEISHSVNARHVERYEPFYVSSDVIPPHDERFLGYGFTRTSQVLEAKMAGWKFKVLTPIFCIHWDLQTMASIRGTPQIVHANLLHMRKSKPSTNTGLVPRHLQTSRNYIKYKIFIRELMTKYNVTSGRGRTSTAHPKLNLT